MSHNVDENILPWLIVITEKQLGKCMHLLFSWSKYLLLLSIYPFLCYYKYLSSDKVERTHSGAKIYIGA